MKKSEFWIILLIIAFVFWKFLLPGPRVANDFPYASSDTVKTGFDLPQTWQRSGENFGGYNVLTLWSWPIDLFYGLGVTIGADFFLLVRIFEIFFMLTLGYFSISKLLDSLGVKRTGRLMGTLFYLLNTFLILLVDGGQLAIALAYTWFPMAFLLVKRSLKEGLRSKLSAGMGVSVLGFFDIRFIYILISLLAIDFIYESLFLEKREVGRYILSYTKSAIIISLIFLGLNFYWILPAVLVKTPALPPTYQRVTQTSFLSFANLGHSLFLLQPHWSLNVFGRVIPLKTEFILIPILVFIAPLLRKKSKTVGFWLLVAIVGVFLVKGESPPLSGVYPWLFANIPGFSLFRDPTKFFFLVAISCSVLIGITTDELVKRFNWSLVIGRWSVKVIPLLFIAYFLLLIRPVWLGNMTGMFSEPYNKEDFYNTARYIERDPDFGRVLWIPSRPPLGFSSPTHPTVEASRLIQKRPFAVGTVGTYETFNFLREAPFMGEIFDIAGIKYIGYPFPDTRREELKKDNVDYYNAFLEQLTNLPWIYGRTPDPVTSLLKVRESRDHFFLANNTFCVVGSDRIYQELIKIPDFKLNNNALIFLEEKPETGTSIKDQQCTYILYGKESLDLTATLIDKSRFIFPAEKLDFSPSTDSGSSSWPASRSLGEGWWKREASDLIWWRNFLREKYGIDNLDFDFQGGYAISEGNRELSITNDQFSKGKILLARVMKSTKSGEVEFYQGGERIGEADTKIEEPEKVEVKLTGYGEIPDQIFEYDKADFGWFEVGKLASDKSLSIKTEGDINVINALVSIPEEEWMRINELIHNYKVIKWTNLDEREKSELFGTKEQYRLTYFKISPTHYKVSLQGFNELRTLAFSETYDSQWQIKDPDGKISYSYPLYSLINGFSVEKDGEYDIYFEPQKYVYPGLIVSGLTLFAIVFYLIFTRKNEGKVI